MKTFMNNLAYINKNSTVKKKPYESYFIKCYSKR